MGTPRCAGDIDAEWYIVHSLPVVLPAFPRLAARMATVGLHTKVRQSEYLGGTKRFPVPDDKVPWSVDWPEYQPVDYTALPVLKGPVWADQDIRSGSSISVRLQ